MGVYACFKCFTDAAPLDMVDLKWRKHEVEEPYDFIKVDSDIDFWNKNLFQKSPFRYLKYPSL